MVKWFGGSSSSQQDQDAQNLSPIPNVTQGAAASSMPTPPPAPAPSAVVFTQPEPPKAPVDEAPKDSQTLPPLPPLPASTPASAPEPSMPVTPAEPMDKPEEAPKEAVIEMSDRLPLKNDEAGDVPISRPFESGLFESALESSASPDKTEEPADDTSEEITSEPEAVATALKDVAASDEPSAPSTPRSAAPEPDLPDVSNDIRRLLQERWITLADQQLNSLAKRREEITTQLAELEMKQRELATRRQSLEDERTDVLQQTEGWNNKLTDAQKTLDKVLEDVSSL